MSFAARCDALKRTLFAQLRSESRKTREVEGRAEGLVRVARRWPPLGKFMKLAGILVPVALGELRAAARPEEAVRVHWAPTFSVPYSDFDVDAPKAWASPFATALDFSRTPLPSLGAYEKILQRASVSSPWPDGLSYAVFRHAGRSAARALQDLGVAMMCGGARPDTINDSVMVFPPKNVTADEYAGREQVIRPKTSDLSCSRTSTTRPRLQ